MRRHELTDYEWSVIQALLPRNSRGIPRVDDRRVIKGILWRFRTGSSWRDVPERYGPRTTLYNRFTRWRAVGICDWLPEAVSRAYDGDIVMIDSSCVRVHQHGAAGKKWDLPDPCVGRSRGGLTTKIHTLVDVEGRPLRLELTAAQAGDAPMAAKLLAAVAPGATVIADKAYNTDGIRTFVNARGAWANIPPRSMRKGTFAFSRLGLSPEKPRRALLQPHKADERPRHPLRPQSRQLPRRHQARSHPHLDQRLMRPLPKRTILIDTSGESALSADGCRPVSPAPAVLICVAAMHDDFVCRAIPDRPADSTGKLDQG